MIVSTCSKFPFLITDASTLSPPFVARLVLQMIAFLLLNLVSGIVLQQFINLARLVDEIALHHLGEYFENIRRGNSGEYVSAILCSGTSHSLLNRVVTEENTAHRSIWK